MFRFSYPSTLAFLSVVKMVYAHHLKCCHEAYVLRVQCWRRWLACCRGIPVSLERRKRCLSVGDAQMTYSLPRLTLHMVRVCRLAALGQNSRHHFTRELHPGPLTGGLLLLVYFVWWIFAFICDYGIFCLWWFWSPVEMVEAWLNKLSSSLLTVCIYPTKNFAFIFKVLKGQRDCQQVKLLLSKPCDLS